ncbi:TPA: peptidoglycan DD-metalloendopeptidase family protein [Legionella feeleii]
MDQRPNVSLESSAKPSKLLALIALVIAFALPFVLVKSFPHKHKTGYSENRLSVPELEEPSSIPVTAVRQAAATVRTQNTPAKAAPKVSQPSKTTVQASAATKPKSVAPAPTPAPPAPENEWKTVITKSGDSLATVFNRLGLSPKILQAIIHDNPHARTLTHLKQNQQLQFLIKKHTLQKMIIPFSETQYLVVSKEGQRYKSKVNSRKMNSYNHYVTATVRGSLYSTAKRNNIPYKLIQQMTEIFTWDINFAKEVRAGDQFTIIYEAFYIENKVVGTGNIIAVSYKNRGKTYQAIRHTDKSGNSEYYSPQGTGLKKAFNRYPLRFSHISSTFSLSRTHPILHYKRPHKGVDLAAPIGTPITATGNGRIEIIGRQSGYGNMIKISHNKLYSTIYGHMLRFQKGLSRGSYVKRGQVIGYVGQTGLATGPHCHYEFHINRQPKNPTTVDLPRGLPVPAREMASFKTKSNLLLAQLKQYERAALASKGPNKPHKIA